VVESVVVVNPGYLSKREKAGTYAKMIIYPRSLTGEEKASPVVAHQVFERARVDIVRI
jgi:DNA polymerase alpha subunit B